MTKKMSVVEFLQDYRHSSSRTWKKGDRPTISNSLAVRLMLEKKVKWLAIGCGCPGQADKL